MPLFTISCCLVTAMFLALLSAPLYGQAVVSHGLTALAVNPHSPGVLLAGTFNRGLFRSKDSGNTWEVIWEPRGGVSSELVTDIYFDRNHEDIVYLTIDNNNNPGIEGGVFKSIDGGTSWQNISGGQVHATSEVVVGDPMVPNVIYVGGKGAIFRSDDGGMSWKQLPSGNSVGDVKSIAIHPLTQELYIAVGNSNHDSRLYKSNDGGRSWELIMTDLLIDQILIVDIELHPEDPDTLYIGTFDGVYKSTTGGKSWKKIGLDWINDLTLDSSHPNRIYAGVNSHSPMVGLYYSIDAGETWKRILSDDPFQLVDDPFQVDTIFASLAVRRATSGYDFGVFRITVDDSGTSVQGESWGRVKQFQGK